MARRDWKGIRTQLNVRMSQLGWMALRRLQLFTGRSQGDVVEMSLYNETLRWEQREQREQEERRRSEP